MEKKVKKQMSLLRDNLNPTEEVAGVIVVVIVVIIIVIIEKNNN